MTREMSLASGQQEALFKQTKDKDERLFCSLILCFVKSFIKDVFLEQKNKNIC